MSWSICMRKAAPSPVLPSGNRNPKWASCCQQEKPSSFFFSFLNRQNYRPKVPRLREGRKEDVDSAEISVDTGQFWDSPTPQKSAVVF